MQIRFEYGPNYYFNDYFPHFHFQAGAALACEDYNLLTEYWGNRDSIEFEQLDTESRAAELLEGGAVDEIDRLGL